MFIPGRKLAPYGVLRCIRSRTRGIYDPDPSLRALGAFCGISKTPGKPCLAEKVNIPEWELMNVASVRMRIRATAMSQSSQYP
jgi:hypothetical protein